MRRIGRTFTHELAAFGCGIPYQASGSGCADAAARGALLAPSQRFHGVLASTATPEGLSDVKVSAHFVTRLFWQSPVAVPHAVKRCGPTLAPLDPSLEAVLISLIKSSNFDKQTA